MWIDPNPHAVVYLTARYAMAPAHLQEGITALQYVTVKLRQEYDGAADIRAEFASFDHFWRHRMQLAEAFLKAMPRVVH